MASDRANQLRQALDLNSNAVDRTRIIADNNQNKIKCGFCNVWIKNKKYNLEKHFKSRDSHDKAYENYKRQKQLESINLDHIAVVVKLATEKGRHVDTASVLARRNFVRHILIAGIPANSIDALLPFLEHHVDFSLTRTSDMMDSNMESILLEEIKELEAELREAGFTVLGFDGTTHLGEMSFFVARYWRDKKIIIKCIAAKHADKSMDAATLSSLIKAVCTRFGLKYSPHVGSGTLSFVSSLPSVFAHTFAILL